MKPDSANVLVGNFLLLFMPTSTPLCPFPFSLILCAENKETERSFSLGSPGMSALGTFNKILWWGNMPKQKGSERFRQLSQLLDRILGFRFLSRLDTPSICPRTSPQGALKVTKGLPSHPYWSMHRGQSLSPLPQLLSRLSVKLRGNHNSS